MRVSRSRRDFLKKSASVCGACALTGSFPRWLVAEETKQREEWVSFRNGHECWGIAPSPLPNNLELLWELQTPDGVASTAVIADGKAFVGTVSGDLHCLELRTGKEIWKYRSVEEVDPNSFPPAFNAPLALSEHLILAGDDFGTFHAVDRQTGQRRWTAETDSEIVGGAQVRGERVIFGSHDGFLYCHDVDTGRQIWKVETHGPVNGTPCFSDRYTFTTGCDQPILRVIDVEEGKEAAEIEIDALLIASAAVRDGILYFGTDGGVVTALDWKKKETVWEFSVPERQQQIHSSPAVTEELVVIGSRDKHVHCLDRRTGAHRWSFATRARVDSSPVIAGDRVYFGSSDRTLYAVTLAEGKEAWQHPAGQPVTASPAIADGCLVIGTDSSNGKILCFGDK